MEMLDLNAGSGEWLRGTGPESDVVISSRVRLARNLAQFPFLERLSQDDRKKVLSLVRSKIERSRIAPNLIYVDLGEADSLDRQVLVERHLISRELAEGEGSRGVIFTPDESLALMINEEDHLRMQVLRSGLQIESSWREINSTDSKLEKRLPLAFSPELGYLTACPTNVGTGMRVSVMLHLPALAMTKQIDKIINAVSRLSLAVRGFYGEGTQAFGDFYQVSNQITLGQTEEEIIQSLESVIPEIITSERNAREALLSENRVGLEDRVWRSYGIIKNAREINTEETMRLLSGLRLGVNLRLIPNLEIHTINEIFIMTQPAHLQKMEGKKLNERSRDVARASYIRSRLDGVHR